MDYGLHKGISPLINLMHLLANHAALKINTLYTLIMGFPIY